MLRAIVSLQHCVKNVIDSWMANSGYKISRYPNEPTYGRGLVAKNDGALGVDTATASTRSLAVIDFTPFMAKSGASTISFGFKVRLEQLGLNFGDFSMWIDHNGFGATGTAFLYFSHYFDANSKVGDEKLIETTIDLTTGGFSTYFNGVLAGTASVSAANLAGFKIGQFQICADLASAGYAGSISLRNFWVTDDTAGDDISGRIGDVNAVPIVLDEASGAGWAASDGSSMLTALKAAPESANPVLVNSSNGAGDLQVGLSIPALPANTVIRSIMLLAAGKASATGAMGVSLKKGTAVTGKRPIALDTTLRYGLPLGSWGRAPDGTRWTQANVDATSVSITPDL